MSDINEGIYAQYSKFIKEQKNDNKLVIDVEKLAECVDFSEMPREELERRCKRAAASVALNQNGYKSVLRGEGLFVDYVNCTNPIFLQHLVENTKIDAIQAETAMKTLQKIMKQNAEELPDYVQIAFQFDSEGHSKMVDELSLTQILEMLRAEAG